MKKITIVLLSLAFYNFGYAQNPMLEELLIEYQNLPTNGASIQHFFNSEEIAILQDYFSSQSQNTESNQGDANAIIYGPNVTAFEFVTFNVNNPSSLTFINTSLNVGDFEACGDIDPTDSNRAYVLTLANGNFFELDISSGIYTSVGTIAPPAGEDWTGIEFDPATNILYGISSDFVGTSTVSIIDMDNLSFTAIGQTDIPGAISIATDGLGNFYSHDVVADSFYTIDITTGVATLVGPIGFEANFGQDMEWDAVSQTLYMAAFNSTTFAAELRVVDTTTGDTQFIGNIGTGTDTQMSWAAIQNEPLTIEDFNETNISLFPNPSSTVLNINSSVAVDTIVMYNALGQKMESYTSNDPLQYSINIEGISQGIYVIEMQTSSGTLTKKFIKR